MDIEAQFSINQSRADEITMREDYGNLPMTIHDDGFGDIGFDADGPDFIRDDVDANIDVCNQILTSIFIFDHLILRFFFFFKLQENLISDDLDLDDRSMKEPVAGTSRMQDIDSSQMITDDGFGGSSFGRMLFYATNKNKTKNAIKSKLVYSLKFIHFVKQKNQLPVCLKVICLPMLHYLHRRCRQSKTIQMMTWMRVGIWVLVQRHQGK